MKLIPRCLPFLFSGVVGLQAKVEPCWLRRGAPLARSIAEHLAARHCAVQQVRRNTCMTLFMICTQKCCVIVPWQVSLFSLCKQKHWPWVNVVKWKALFIQDCVPFSFLPNKSNVFSFSVLMEITRSPSWPRPFCTTLAKWPGIHPQSTSLPVKLMWNFSFLKILIAELSRKVAKSNILSDF